MLSNIKTYRLNKVQIIHMRSILLWGANAEPLSHRYDYYIILVCFSNFFFLLLLSDFWNFENKLNVDPDMSV